MKEQNGIQIFEKGESLPPLPIGLSELAGPILSMYGFRIVEHDGKAFWVPGTERDYRLSEGKRLNIPPTEVRSKNEDNFIFCAQVGESRCNGGRCDFIQHRCTLLYHPDRKYYYCACV